MNTEPRPTVAAVISFIDCINRGDVDGLGSLMTDDHALRVLDEQPLHGKDANLEARHANATAYASYAIHPRQICERDGEVAVLGHTTGSHLGLPDEDERKLTSIWIARVDRGLLSDSRIVEDGSERPRELGLDFG